LACRYASSDEFEAALISERRAAGVYGPKRRRRHVLLAGAAGSMLAVVLWMICPLRRHDECKKNGAP
jgi:hypothetical protein